MKMLIALALLFGVALGLTDTADAKARWQNFGADKAYTSPEAAKADIANVLVRVGYDRAVAVCVQERVQSHEADREVTLTNGDTLDWMRTGRTGLWRNVLVDFARPPVDENGVQYAVTAKEWDVTCHGVTITIGLPAVCNNLYGRSLPPPKKAELRCKYVVMEARPGDWAINFALSAYKPSACPALNYVQSEKEVAAAIRDVDGWGNLPTRCGGPCTFEDVIQAAKYPIVQTGGFGVAPGYYIFRLAPDTELVVFCLQRGATLHSCGIDVYDPDYLDYGGYRLATIFYDLAERPRDWAHRFLYWAFPDHAGNCPLD